MTTSRFARGWLALSTVTVLAWAAPAAAQDTPPAADPGAVPPPPGAPAPGQPAPPAPGQPAPPAAGDPGVPPPPSGAAPPPAPAPAPTGKPQPTDEELAEQTRFRFAIHVMGGPWFVPDRTGGAGGLGLQLGAQINDMVGVYYSGTAAIGVAGGDNASGVGASVGAFVYNAVMADVTIGRLIQIGAGPSLDSLAFASSTTSANPVTGVSQKTVALGGSYFGLQTRVGLALGKDKPGKAGRFMVGLEVHPTFADVVPVGVYLTLGGGRF